MRLCHPRRILRFCHCYAHPHGAVSRSSVNRCASHHRSHHGFLDHDPCQHPAFGDGHGDPRRRDSAPERAFRAGAAGLGLADRPASAWNDCEHSDWLRGVRGGQRRRQALPHSADPLGRGRPCALVPGKALRDRTLRCLRSVWNAHSLHYQRFPVLRIGSERARDAGTDGSDTCRGSRNRDEGRARISGL